MKLEKILVILTAAFFLVYGVLFALFPGALSDMVTGGVPATASGLIDMRATYGGMSIAVGLLMFLLAMAPQTLEVGLLAVVLVLMGMATTRTLGILLDGSANSLMYVYLSAEVVPAIVALLLYRRMRTNG